MRHFRNSICNSDLIEAVVTLCSAGKIAHCPEFHARSYGSVRGAVSNDRPYRDNVRDGQATYVAVTETFVTGRRLMSPQRERL